MTRLLLLLILTAVLGIAYVGWVKRAYPPEDVCRQHQQQEAQSEVHHELPHGYYLEYHTGTKEYRWCDAEDFCTSFSGENREKVIKRAWQFYNYRLGLKDGSWKREKKP